MAIRNLDQWEDALRRVLDQVDALLEDRFGKTHSLSHNRPPRGATANPKYDGLFAVEAKFSLGLGRREGPGYSVEIRMATFEDVPEDIRTQIHDVVAETLRQKIPQAFPASNVQIAEKGSGFLIHGDLGWD